MNKSLALALGTLMIASPALAQEEAMMNQIEKVQGDSVGFGEAFGKLQDGFLFDTAAENLADLAAYPLVWPVLAECDDAGRRADDRGRRAGPRPGGFQPIDHPAGDEG